MNREKIAKEIYKFYHGTYPVSVMGDFLKLADYVIARERKALQNYRNWLAGEIKHYRKGYLYHKKMLSRSIIYSVLRQCSRQLKNRI